MPSVSEEEINELDIDIDLTSNPSGTSVPLQKNLQSNFKASFPILVPKGAEKLSKSFIISKSSVNTTCFNSANLKPTRETGAQNSTTARDFSGPSQHNLKHQAEKKFHNYDYNRIFDNLF